MGRLAVEGQDLRQGQVARPELRRIIPATPGIYRFRPAVSLACYTSVRAGTQRAGADAWIRSPGGASATLECGNGLVDERLD